MKLLRNPLVVGLLAVAALALVFWNIVWPKLRSAPRPARPPGAAVAPTLTSPLTAPMRVTEQARELARKLRAQSAAAAEAASAATEVDTAALRKDSARWMETPRRDPFQVRQGPASTTNSRYPPARELLTLGGIWRQTGSTLATINKKVVREGDLLLKFTIETIDSDRVWVQGPNGREALEFKAAVPASANGSPKTSPKADPEVPKPSPQP